MSIEMQPSISSVDPLFAPFEEPNRHRSKPKKSGVTAEIKDGRRPSPIAIVQNLRAEVSQWRLAGYPGTSDTTRELLAHWFLREHRFDLPTGESFPFNYYFCQRESIETFIYLRECRSILTQSALTENFGPGSAEERFTAALGIAPDEDKWPRYAFKIATGAGKTKCMSLAITWSYFHALRESDSPMAKHFLLIAPNLIVFERLKEDFEHGKIFYSDPLVPQAWRGDFNPSVILQDEIAVSASAPIIYLTNIHRLYDLKARRKSRDEDSYDWMGPAVSKAKALDLSQALRDRIIAHPKLMVLNDEAHHVWDPDSTWNECIEYLRDGIKRRSDNELVAQLDFSATPKDNKGNLFKHIVCDAPLGEVIDGGIVKTPVIGSGKIQERTSDNAAVKYQHHLLLGYNRWQDSFDEWQRSGKKALMFVMTEDAEAADQIAQELNTNECFRELNGKTLNLHTRLKGKLKKKGKGTSAYYVFEESEKDISDEDLRFLRDLARDLDKDESPFRCIVSVLMLREGWDVRNVTTIVPLRAFTSKANILPEQTLGRGLRRMTPPGQANEIVTVVEHPAFANLYKDELAQQGVFIDVVEVEKVPRTTISIFPDAQNKDLEKLRLLVPTLTPGFSRSPKLDGLTLEDVKTAFSKYRPLPVGEKSTTSIEYVGKHLITDEVIHQMTIQLPLLQVPGGSISFYRTELERHTKLTGLKSVLDPLLEKFVQEILFETPVSIYDSDMLSRYADDDVREHIRATFVPLIQQRTTFKEDRKTTEQVVNIALWKPFQAAYSHSRPVQQAAKTPFNLVPCNNAFEAALGQFLDRCSDVVSFCKNAGPQCLRIDYINSSGQLALYTPDFIARTSDGKYYLIEGKGKEDKDVPLKARAADEWCKSASSKQSSWEYVYISQALFQTFTRDTLAALARTTAAALGELLSDAPNQQLKLPLAEFNAKLQQETALEKFIDPRVLNELPSLYKTSIEQSITLFMFCENQKDFSFSSVFTPLLKPLDMASVTLIDNLLSKYVPTNPNDQKNFFDIGGRLHAQAQNLRKTLVYKSGLSPIGLLKFCLTFENRERLGGVFAAVIHAFKPFTSSDLVGDVETVNEFRNTYIAHQELVLTDAKLAEVNLKYWIDTILKLYKLNYPDPVSPDWFVNASKNLALIETNAADYDHPEEGDKAPSKEVFVNVRSFLDVLRASGAARLDVPRIFVSPTGQLVLTFGDKEKSLDVRFTATEILFYFKHPDQPPIKGNEQSAVVQLILKYFHV